jgi:hypothetical protein
MRLVLAVCVLALSSLAHADGMRCGDRLVSEGESLSEISLKCGAPTRADRRVAIRSTDCVSVEVTIDTWLYNLGPKSFQRILTFENGRLLSIETASYGY